MDSDDGLSARVALPMTVRAPRTARSVARLVLREWGVSDDDALDSLMTMISEVVTNAVVHGVRTLPRHHGLWLELELIGDVVRVGVVDRDETQQPRRLAAGPDDESGRGLAIVEALADAWSWEPLVGGKRVWFEKRVAVLFIPAQSRGPDTHASPVGSGHRGS